MNHTEKEIARIIKEQVEWLEMYSEAGVDPRKVKRFFKWWILEAELLWYDFKLKMQNRFDRFGN